MLKVFFIAFKFYSASWSINTHRFWTNLMGANENFLLQLTVYNYNGGPCYRCLFPSPPPTTACQRCADSGVLGVGKFNCVLMSQISFTFFITSL